MGFSSLQLIEPLVRAIAGEGYSRPTPIQGQAIPHVLGGRDLLGIAQTGTGKTAAFVLPILQGLVARGAKKGVRVLVLAPTRELASQIDASVKTYGKHTPVRSTVIFGGVGQEPQVQALRRGVDVLVATPGRLLDLLNQRHVVLDGVEVLVLDEADRMLDMGFIHDVRKIVARVPRARQTLLFSATMPEEIVSLSKNILRDPVRVEVTPVATTVEKIDQSVYFVDKANKRRLLTHLLGDPAFARVLVFTRTKHGADRVVKDLARDGLDAMAIHGNKGQGARERALAQFKSGETRVLVATDIAARGIDVDGITHVVNFDLPNIPDSYVHRIGRTARAGAGGTAISFCDSEERAFLADIEKLIRLRVRRVEDHPYRPGTAGPLEVEAPRPPRQPQHHRARQPQPSRQAQPSRSSSSSSGSGEASSRGGAAAPRPAASTALKGRRTFGAIRR